MPIVLVTPTPITNTYTSGTVGNTVIDTAGVLEHAFRRVKVHPSQQTPETVQIAKENLYLLLLNMANRGLNLWCVQSDFIGLNAGKHLYDMTPGTIDVLNVIYAKPVRATGTDTTTATSITTELISTTTVCRFGLKFSTIAAAEMVTIEKSTDGVVWESVTVLNRSDFAVDTWYWVNPTLIPSATYFRARAVGVITVSEFYLASAVSDLPVIQWNRDTWSTINNKFQSGSPATNYYLERLLEPRLTLWPVPNNSYDHLQVFVQRQIQDIGVLSQSIEIPQRWVESVIWQLAARLAFELPQVDPSIIQTVLMMSDKMLLEVEREETDGAPIMLQPRISVYTR